MKVLIERAWKKETYTIGRVYVDGKLFCNSMEDKDRGLRQSMTEAEVSRMKVYGMTAIPTGKYVVKMTYSPKYKRNMPEVKDVKGFTGIRIHSGNTAEDSLGCILLGHNKQKGMILESRKTCAEFERMLVAAKGVCELEIR
jgi:hypothetical protein